MKMSILKNSKITFVLLMLIGLMTSCQKEKQEDVLPTTTTTQGANFFQSQNRSTQETNSNSTDEFLCFAISYPIEIIFPDGTKQSANSDNELETIIENWFDANPTSEDFPTFTFPINVTLEDGTQESVANDDELCDLFEACWDDEEYEGEGELEELCFDFIYPVTLVLPDGSNVQTNNDEELEEAIFDWYDANPNSNEDVTFAYPIQIIEEDGNQREVNSDDELEMLIELCEGEFHDDCFTLNYPLTILFPDTTSVEVTDDENLYQVVDAWYDANPNSDEDPNFEYPISVTLEDGTQQTINSEKELEELFDECYGDECEIEGDDIFLGGASSAASKVAVAKQKRN